MLGAQPAVVCVRKHGIEQHQPLDHPAERRGLPVAVIRLTNGLVQGLELDIGSILSDSKTGVPASSDPQEALEPVNVENGRYIPTYLPLSTSNLLHGISSSTISDCSFTCSSTISRPSGEMSKSRTLKSGARSVS